MPGYTEPMSKPESSGDLVFTAPLNTPTDRFVRADGSQVVIKFPFEQLAFSRQFAQTRADLEVVQDRLLALRERTSLLRIEALSIAQALGRAQPES